jgi:hypothetical protein
MEQQRDHVLGGPVGSDSDIFAAEAGLLAEAARQQTEPDLEDAETGFEALDSQAHFDRVVFDGGEFGQHAAVGSLAEQEYLGLPGLLEPEQVATLLRQRQAQQLKASRRPVASPQVGEPVRHRRVGDLRKELNGLVAAWHHRTGQPHGQIHAELRTACGGPVTALAGETELQQRIDTLRGWATAGRR